MLLRASSEQDQTDYDLQSVTDEHINPGVAHGDHLRALTEATIRGDWLSLGGIRRRAEAAMGEQQTVDALVVAAAFNGITRVADATGVPLDDNTATTTVSLRAETGIDEFAYAAKSARYDQSI